MRRHCLKAHNQRVLCKTGSISSPQWTRPPTAIAPRYDTCKGRVDVGLAFHNRAINQQQHSTSSDGTTSATSWEGYTQHAGEAHEHQAEATEEEHTEPQHRYTLSSGTEVIEHEQGNGAYPEEGRSRSMLRAR